MLLNFLKNILDSWYILGSEKKKGDWLLCFGGRGYEYLIKAGAVTDAGAYVKEQGLQVPEEGYDRNQTPFRRGRADYWGVSG